MHKLNSNFPGILSEKYNKNPYQFIDKLNRESGFLYDETLGANIAINYDCAREILQNSKLFSSAPLSQRAEPIARGKVLAQMSDEDHKSRKKMVITQLTTKAFDQFYRDKIIFLCDGLISSIQNRAHFDLVDDFCSSFALKSTFKILDIDDKYFDFFQVHLKKIVQFALSFNMTSQEKEDCLNSAKIVENKLLQLMEGEIGDNLISRMMQKSGNETFTPSEIMALMINILMAATEPVDKVLISSVYLLYRNPQFLEKTITGELPVENIVQETLRFHPPVHLLIRRVEADTNINLIKFNEGDIVYILIPAINRDSQYFSEPRQYNPLKSSKKHLSYGLGIHSCVGAIFANLQLSIALKKLLPIIKEYEETTPPEFSGIYTRGSKSYFLNKKVV